MGDFAIVALLGLWWVASALSQLSVRPMASLRARDVAGVLPRFKFFAPSPARTDCHVLYRHRLQDGGVTPWATAFLWKPNRWRFLWNPDRRGEKAIADAARALSEFGEDEKECIPFSVPYLMLLQYVSHLERPMGADAVQFVLMGSSGAADAGPPFVRFVSNVHQIDDRRMPLVTAPTFTDVA